MTEPGARLGPLAFRSGVTRTNAVTLLFSGFLVAVVLPYINFAQPYLLTEHLSVPTGQQGALSGDLAFYTELVIIGLAGLFGALADRAGLRIVFAGGMLVVGIGLALYPLATATGELVGARLVYAVGAAAVSAVFVAVQSDYPTEATRGRLVGSMGVLSILGVILIIALLTPLPARLVAAGASPVTAGTQAFWIVAAVAVAGAIALWLGLARQEARRERRPVLDNLRDGLRCARLNPRVALACAAGMVGRADLVVVTVFLALWLTQIGVARGFSTDASLAAASSVFAVIQVSALLATPLIAWVADRIDRARMLAGAAGLATAGYAWTGLLTDPTAPSALPAMALLGVGQAAAIIAATALLGAESPRELRGATAGLFSLCGALGILAITKFGGMAFDAWRPGAPFLLIAVANGAIMVAAWLVGKKTS
jgi:MFS family permease